MLWYSEWQNISARVESLSQVTHPFFASVQSAGSDYHGVSNSSIIPSAKSIKESVESFLTTHTSTLPAEVKSRIDDFIKTYNRSSFTGIAGAGSAIVMLSVLRTDVDYLLKDVEFEIATRTEFSFKHLQRLLVADEPSKASWQSAFDAGETKLENLGSVHLLSHRLWAFKAHGVGERTDLLIPEPVDVNAVSLTGSSLILTEWKKINSQSEVAEKAKFALTQAKRYGVGVLNGTELKRTRFLVLVSQDHLSMPSNETDGGVLYKYINIAVKPTSPSVGAGA